MTTPQDTAERYGVITADQAPLPIHRPPEADHKKQRDRWNSEKKAAFKKLAPKAVCVVGTQGPVSITLYGDGGDVKRRIGHNRGRWPARIVTSGVWKDTVTARYNTSPWHWTGLQIRVWTTSAELALCGADLLADLAEEAMGAKLENGFVDLGPDLMLEMLEMQIHDIARNRGLSAWDDDGLSRHLDHAIAAERRHGLRNVARVCR